MRAKFMSPQARKQQVIDLFESGGRSEVSGRGCVTRSIQNVANELGIGYSTARSYLTWLEHQGVLYHFEISVGTSRGKHHYALDKLPAICPAACAQCDCTLPEGHDTEFHECDCGGMWAFGSLEPGDSEHFRIGALPGTRTMFSEPKDRPFDYEVRVLP